MGSPVVVSSLTTVSIGNATLAQRIQCRTGVHLPWNNDMQPYVEDSDASAQAQREGKTGDAIMASHEGFVERFLGKIMVPASRGKTTLFCVGTPVVVQGRRRDGRRRRSEGL